jgi:Fe-S cluster assembly protein SufD
MAVAARAEVLESRLEGMRLPGTGGWLGEAREDALARLRAVGLPARRDEYWRYTDPSPLTGEAPEATAVAAAEDAFAGVDALRIVFDGGRLASDLPEAEGLEIVSLAAAGSVDIHWAREQYGKLEAAGSRPISRPLAMLNSAFATDGLLIRVTGQVARPVLIEYRDTSEGSDAILHHCVKVESGAATILEVGQPATRGNLVMEVDVASGAAFHHLRAQGPGNDRLTNTYLFARLADGATLKSFTLAANGRLTRNETILDLAGDDANAHTAAAALGRGGDVVNDDTVFVTHGGERGESRQVFKKVLRDGATGVFQGKILVKEGAQKTDGYQISKALLLDDDSVFLAKPELEIYADDVACSHGSTTGAIDETALFYLRSRGVDRKRATDLLVLSFLAEAVEEIADEGLREAVLAQLEAWLDRGV